MGEADGTTVIRLSDMDNEIIEIMINSETYYGEVVNKK
jgi:hypothetical protein